MFRQVAQIVAIGGQLGLAGFTPLSDIYSAGEGFRWPVPTHAALGGLVYVAVLNRLGLDPEDRQVWDGVLRKIRLLKPSLTRHPPSGRGPQ